MTTSDPMITKVREVEYYDVTYKQNSVLGGFIKWWTKISQTRMYGADLDISTNVAYDHIYINGKEFVRKVCKKPSSKSKER